MGWEKCDINAVRAGDGGNLEFRSQPCPAGRGHNRSPPTDDSGKSGKFHTTTRGPVRAPQRLEENSSNTMVYSGSPRLDRRQIAASD